MSFRAIMNKQRPVWCIRANIADQPLGTSQFTPEESIYCVPPLAGEIMKVVGRHRQTYRYVAVVISANRLTNWEAVLVDDPQVIAELLNQRHGWDESESSREQAEALVRMLREQFSYSVD